MAAAAVIIVRMGDRRHAAKKDAEVVAFASVGCEDSVAKIVEAAAYASTDG